MSKKRVHEIAKELKAHGFELDNKEVVTELMALGYDVKSHSSSLDEDQANAAVQKMLDKRKPRTAPPPLAAKGFVVRRKTGPVHTEAESATYAQTADEPVYAPAEAELAHPLAPPVEEPQAVQPPEEIAAAPEAPAAAPPPEPMTAVPTSSAESAAGASAAASAPPPPPAIPQTRPNQAVIISRPAPGTTYGQRPPMRSGSNRPGSAPPPGVEHRPQIQGAGPRPGVPNAPNMGGGRMGRPMGSQSQSYGAGPQASASPTPSLAPPAGIGMHPPAAPRPTATQAVVISRPLIQVRRVTPSSTAHRNIPLAPGKKAIGEVREFKVVPDHLGRGREFVDITKKKEEAQRGKKRTTEKDGVFNKAEMDALVWGRVQIPVRGKKRKPTKKGAKTQITEMAEEKKIIKLQEAISVSELSQRMGIKTSEIIKKLMTGGTMATANQMLDSDSAAVIATDYGWKIEKVGFEIEDHLPDQDASPEDARPRPPVVTVMGHVDHGKTSLLDAIRSASVATGEAGGITQHIGAYTVMTPKGEITFLDTPGHEAFTSMRARGAEVTDIVVLVVAADDGVMPQTVEAINHAKAAGVPIVVAINKMDVPGANPDRVKKDLATHELVPEDWGGETIMVPVSARTKMGLDLLLENIGLQAEVLELKSNPNQAAVGAIIEAKLEKGRGPVATVLIQEGTLRTGDAVVTGIHYGRVRAMKNSRGEQVKEVLPGYSAEVVGLSGVPSAGDSINVVEDEKAAKEIAEHRAMKERQKDIGKTSKDSLENLFARAKAGESKELRLVLKADVQGSLEAVIQAVAKLSTPKVKAEIIHKGVGAMTESDVMLAAASKGMVIGFNVKPESGAEAAAREQQVAIQVYSIIYELIDGVRNGMEGLLEPIRTERKLGRAEVRNLFNVPKLGTIAGASVIDGTIKRSSLVRLLRDNKQVYTGKMASLRRFKDDVREVAQGFECGIGIENYNDLKPGDIIEAYEIEETRPSLA